MSEIISLFVLVMLLLIVALVYPEIDAKLFFPVLEKGFIPVLKGAYPPALFFAETIIMVMLIPYLPHPGSKKTIIKYEYDYLVRYWVKLFLVFCLKMRLK